MSLHKQAARQCINASECIFCCEKDCFGCSLTAPPVGACLVCGKDVLLDDFYEWRGEDPVHWDCLDEFEEGEECDFKNSDFWHD